MSRTENKEIISTHNERRYQLTWLVRSRTGVSVTFRFRWRDPHLQLRDLREAGSPTFVQPLPPGTAKHVFVVPVESRRREVCHGDNRDAARRYVFRWRENVGWGERLLCWLKYILPPVRVLQEAAARASGGRFGVNNFEAGAGQLEWNLWDLHFLRQRPKRAIFGSLGNELSLPSLNLVDVVRLKPPTEPQGQEQHR